jgi:hypothetical protein
MPFGGMMHGRPVLAKSSNATNELPCRAALLIGIGEYGSVGTTSPQDASIYDPAESKRTLSNDAC